MGRTFQKNNLFKSLSVRENVRLAVQAKRGKWYDPLTPTTRDRTLWERADVILEMLRLGGDLDRPVRNLSYGEQRQLEIAIGLAAEPKLLLLDEPTSGMSPAETERMIRLIEELPRELALLMIEHDMNLVAAVSNRALAMNQGSMLAMGTPRELQEHPDVIAAYLGS